MVLGVELRAFHLLDRCSTTSTMPLALFSLVIFEIGSHFYAQEGLDCDLPIYASYIARLTGMCHHAQLFIG
jgi:hypothetical protein